MEETAEIRGEDRRGPRCENEARAVLAEVRLEKGYKTAEIEAAMATLPAAAFRYNDMLETNYRKEQSKNTCKSVKVDSILSSH